MLTQLSPPFCSSSDTLFPAGRQCERQYEAAATKLKNESIKLAKVDCTEEQDLCSEHGVQGYP